MCTISAIFMAFLPSLSSKNGGKRAEASTQEYHKRLWRLLFPCLSYSLSLHSFEGADRIWWRWWDRHSVGQREMREMLSQLPRECVCERGRTHTQSFLVSVRKVSLATFIRPRNVFPHTKTIESLTLGYILIPISSLDILYFAIVVVLWIEGRDVS